MKTCCHCGNKYAEDLVRCPACGSMAIIASDKASNDIQQKQLTKNVNNRMTTNKNSFFFLIALVLLVVLFLTLSQSNRNDNPSASDNQVLTTISTGRYSGNVQDTQINIVDLTTIIPYYEGEVEIIQNGITDTMDNRYNSGLRGYMAPGDTTKYNVSCFSIWNIGGEYKQLTAKGIVREKDKGSSYTGSYKIYGDGKLLYQKNGIDSMTKPYDISVDVSNVTDLKIEMYGNGNAGTNGINSVLVDVMLHK